MVFKRAGRVLWGRATRGTASLFCLCLMAFLIQWLFRWPILTISHMRGWRVFADAFQVLKSGECYSHVGLAVYQNSPGNWCSNYVYGRTLLIVLNFFHISTSLTCLVGFVFMIIVAFFLALFVRRNLAGKTLVFGAAIIFSPPIVLLIERGNFDSLMFGLVCISVVLLKKGARNLSMVTLGISAMIKFYTLPLMLFYFFPSEKGYRRLFPWVWTALVSYLTLTDATKAKSLSVNNPNASFGSPMAGLLLRYININLNHNANLILGLMLLTICTAVIWLFRRRLVPFQMLFQNLNGIKIFDEEVVFGSIFVICYLFGLNYDYRLIFLVPALLNTISRQTTASGRNLFISLSIGVFWLSYDSRFLQPIGDVLIGILCSYYINLFFVIYKKRKFTHEVP